MKKVWILAAAFAVSMVGTVQAEEIQAKSLAELLQLVKDGKVVNASTSSVSASSLPIK